LKPRFQLSRTLALLLVTLLTSALVSNVAYAAAFTSSSERLAIDPPVQTTLFFRCTNDNPGPTGCPDGQKVLKDVGTKTISEAFTVNPLVLNNGVSKSFISNSLSNDLKIATFSYTVYLTNTADTDRKFMLFFALTKDGQEVKTITSEVQTLSNKSTSSFSPIRPIDVPMANQTFPMGAKIDCEVDVLAVTNKNGGNFMVSPTDIQLRYNGNAVDIPGATSNCKIISDKCPTFQAASNTVSNDESSCPIFPAPEFGMPAALVGALGAVLVILITGRLSTQTRAASRSSQR
jgi:hypothetical protein